MAGDNIRNSYLGTIPESQRVERVAYIDKQNREQVKQKDLQAAQQMYRHALAKAEKEFIQELREK